MTDASTEKSNIFLRYQFVIFLLVLQCVFIVLFGIHAEYGLQETETEFYYSFFQDVHVMMFVGFGFLMTFLHRYSFSAVCFNFLLAAFALEWAILLRGYVFHWHSHSRTFPVDITSLLHADFVCASVLISFGAIIGKVNPIQLIILALIEIVIQVWNQYIGTQMFCVYDAGEFVFAFRCKKKRLENVFRSIFVHVFGAYFGLAVSFVIHRTDMLNSTKEKSNYISDVFAMIGTLFLFCFWPSFNAGAAHGDDRLRAIVNTYVSISSSCILTFIISFLVNQGKLDIVHIQNSTLAGGVAVGTVADKNIGLFGAMIIGSVAGTISTLGYKYLLEFLRRFRLHDTCGVHNLHGLPGLISGTAGIIVAAINNQHLLTETCLGGLHRSNSMQAKFQLAALVLTLVMAIVGGLVTGLIIRLPIFVSPKSDFHFDDSPNWHIEH